MVALKSYRKHSDSQFFIANFSAKINYKATAPDNNSTQIRKIYQQEEASFTLLRILLMADFKLRGPNKLVPATKVSAPARAHSAAV
jgi:hypothetical protein